MIKIKYNSTHTGNPEYNVTNGNEYVVLQLVGSPITDIYAIILADNNSLYMTQNQLWESDGSNSGAWTLTYVSVPGETVLYDA